MESTSPVTEHVSAESLPPGSLLATDRSKAVVLV